MTTTNEPYLTIDPGEAPNDTLPGLIAHDFGKGRYPEDVPSGAPRNAYRASRVAPAVLTYAKEMHQDTGEPLLTSIGDLLTDVRHLVDLFHEQSSGDGDPCDWDNILEGAMARYYEERMGE